MLCYICFLLICSIYLKVDAFQQISTRYKERIVDSIYTLVYIYTIFIYNPIINIPTWFVNLDPPWPSKEPPPSILCLRLKLDFSASILFLLFLLFFLILHSLLSKAWSLLFFFYLDPRFPISFLYFLAMAMILMTCFFGQWQIPCFHVSLGPKTSVVQALIVDSLTSLFLHESLLMLI